MHGNCKVYMVKLFRLFAQAKYVWRQEIEAQGIWTTDHDDLYLEVVIPLEYEFDVRWIVHSLISNTLDQHPGSQPRIASEKRNSAVGRVQWL